MVLQHAIEVAVPARCPPDLLHLQPATAFSSSIQLSALWLCLGFGEQLGEFDMSLECGALLIECVAAVRSLPKCYNDAGVGLGREGRCERGWAASLHIVRLQEEVRGVAVEDVLPNPSSPAQLLPHSKVCTIQRLDRQKTLLLVSDHFRYNYGRRPWLDSVPTPASRRIFSPPCKKECRMQQKEQLANGHAAW